MPTRSAPSRLPTTRRQRGAAFMIMLVILIIGAVTIFVSMLNSSALQIARDQTTADALAKAKDGLVGYAVTYADTHPNQVNGFLPLPDLGSSRNAFPGEGNAAGNFTGNSSNLSVVGRIPWMALHLSPLKDGNSDCLWYAVSGSYQDSQQTSFMNWDTVGEFDTFTSNGTPSGTTSTTGANYHQRPIAIIFSPGNVLSGQDRATSTTDTVTICGGNYDARNYLDTFNAKPQLNGIVNYFAGAINNSTGTFTLTSPKQFIEPVSDTSYIPPLVLANDKVLTITSDDIFRIVKKRNDFGVFVSSILADAVACMSTYPSPVTIDFDTLLETPVTPNGNLTAGRMPNTVFSGTGTCAGASHNATRRWRDNLLYALCSPLSDCLTVNGADCKGVIIFAGERTPSQTRATNAQKNAPWNNYLEGSSLTAFSNGSTSFSGAASYSTASPSTDVLACIP